MKTLVLTEKEVKKLLSMDSVMREVETAFAEAALGHVQMPPKLYLFYPKYNGDLRAMPSYLEALDVSAVKVVNVHTDNRQKYDLPTVMATIILVDPKSGAPLAIMGGTWITEMRTGAAGGVAAKYLARKNSRIVGMIGAGAQARTQLLALLTVFGRLEEVRAWDVSSAARDSYVAEMKQKYSSATAIVPRDGVKETVEGADIVVTTTPSREPLVLNEFVTPGTHLNCIGADAPGKQELDPAILKRAKVVVDDWEQAWHSGEINVPVANGYITKNDIWAQIGDIVTGGKAGRILQEEITVFDSTGLAVQDAVTANYAYKAALQKNLGQLIEIEP